MKENKYSVNLVKVGFGTHDNLMYIIGKKYISRLTT